MLWVSLLKWYIITLIAFACSEYWIDLIYINSSTQGKVNLVVRKMNREGLWVFNLVLLILFIIVIWALQRVTIFVNGWLTDSPLRGSKCVLNELLISLLILRFIIDSLCFAFFRGRLIILLFLLNYILRKRNFRCLLHFNARIFIFCLGIFFNTYAYIVKKGALLDSTRHACAVKHKFGW